MPPSASKISSATPPKAAGPPSREDYIEDKMYEDCGNDESEWVPTNQRGNQKSCNAIRTEITRFLLSGEMTQTAFLEEIGCNNNSYGRFMKLKGPWNGTQNGVYWGAAKFFARKKLGEEWEKKFRPAAAKRKREGAATERKNARKKLDEAASKLSADYAEGPVYDSCPDVRRKITAFLKSSGTTATAFCRMVDVPSNALTRFMKYKPVSGTAKSAESMRYSQPGAAMSIYPRAYHFFERLRIGEGKPKTKKRLENEAALSGQGFQLRHDDGRRWKYIKTVPGLF